MNAFRWLVTGLIVLLAGGYVIPNLAQDKARLTVLTLPNASPKLTTDDVRRIEAKARHRTASQRP